MRRYCWVGESGDVRFDLGLVDELRLTIEPVVADGGNRLFGDDGALRPLRLATSQATSKGAIIAT